MSFILDALKKLEQKRHNGSVPDLMTIHTSEQPPSGKRHLWSYLVIAALVLNAGVLTAVFRPWEADKKREPEKTGFTQEVETSLIETDKIDSTTEETVPAAARHSEKKDIAVQYMQGTDQSSGSMSVAEKDKAGKESSKDSVPIVDPEPASNETAGPDGAKTADKTHDMDIPSGSSLNMSLHEIEKLRDRIKEERNFTVDNSPEHSNAEHRDQSKSARDIPEFSQLPPDIKKNLPDITISGHIFSNNPVARMVNINGNIIREGETVSGGLSLDRITMSGVILTFNGVRFRMRAF